MRSPFLFVNFVRPKISARQEEKKSGSTRATAAQNPMYQCINAKVNQ